MRLAVRSDMGRARASVHERPFAIRPPLTRGDAMAVPATPRGVGAQLACVSRRRDAAHYKEGAMKRLAVAVCLLTLATSAEAYVGPGMGLGVIGAVLGFLTAIVLAFAGMVWYPVKRMIRARRGAARAHTPDETPPTPGAQSHGTEQ